jgi:hypothetical protein
VKYSSHLKRSNGKTNGRFCRDKMEQSDMVFPLPSPSSSPYEDMPEPTEGTKPLPVGVLRGFFDLKIGSDTGAL